MSRISLTSMVFVAACSRGAAPQDLLTWAEDPGHGLVQAAQVGGFRVTARFEPARLRLARELALEVTAPAEAEARLQELAMAEAANGDPESANRARALEAAANHYLTDRFSAGHQFDKDAMMEATAHSPDGLAANVHAKWTHDQMNQAGVEVQSAGASPEAWRALGDGHWADDGNQTNRLKAAGAVYTSYRELDAALQGEAPPEQLREGGYAAYEQVPQWEPARQQAVEAGNHTLDATVSGDAAMFTPYVDEGLSILAGRYIVGPTTRAASAVAGAVEHGAAVAGEAVNDYQESLDEYGIAAPKPGYE